MTVCRWMRGAGVALVIVGAAACSDPATDDNRGYTKAPLEDPGVLIDGEEPGVMAQYGSPNRVVAEELELPEAAPAPVQTSVEPVDLPEGVTPEMVASGEEIFGSTGVCFACHGAGGTGSALAPALNDAEWLNIDGSFESIAALIPEGVAAPKQFPAPMPPRGGSAITDEQVRAVAAYVYSISR